MRLLTTTACLGVLTFVGCIGDGVGPGCNVDVEPSGSRTLRPQFLTFTSSSKWLPDRLFAEALSKRAISRKH